MKLEVGMYARSKSGIIDIIDYEVESEYDDRYAFKNCRLFYREDILKASHNIIDLIEVGDYVLVENSERYQKVVRVCEECNVANKCIQLSTHNYKYHYNNHIKGIVTKEQFESMSYKV